MAEFWGDGSGATKALTTSYVAGSEIEIGNEPELWIDAVLSGTACVAADLKLEVSFDDGTSYVEWPLPIVAIDGSELAARFTVLVPVRSKVRLSAKRRGGAVGTLLLVRAWPRVALVRSPVDGPRIVNKALALDATSDTPAGAAGDALLLDLATEYGEWIYTGAGDTLELVVTKTGANAPTSMLLTVQRREASLGHPVDAIFDVSSGLVTQNASEIKATDIAATDPLRRLYRAEVIPWTWIRVGARYLGGTSPSIVVLARITRR